MEAQHYTSTELSRYLDGEIARSDRELVAAHLTACESCRKTLAELSLGRTALHALSSPDVPESIWSKVGSQVEESIAHRQRARLRQMAIAASILVLAVASSLYIQQFGVPRTLTQTTAPRLAGIAPFDWGLFLSDLDHPESTPRLDRRYAVQDVSLESALDADPGDAASVVSRLETAYRFVSARTLENGSSRALVFEFDGSDGAIHVLVQPSDNPVAFAGYTIQNERVASKECLSVYCSRYRAVSLIREDLTITIIAARQSAAHDRIVTLLTG